MKPPSTLVEVLCARGREQPDRRAYTFLADGEEEAARLTYGELDRRARRIALCLAELDARRERVLLFFPPGLELVQAFCGVLAAGAVAVPSYPPRGRRLPPRLAAIAEDARPRVVLTTAAILAHREALAERSPALARARWRAVDSPEVEAAPAEGWRPPPLAPDDLAFLQYTSGSTAAPKGVMVSHGNLMHNQGLIQAACHHRPGSVFVSWLPLYHDLGLIGNLLQALYVGAPCILMAPVAFLQQPRRWLAAVSRYGATTSGGPDFAYDLCVRRIGPEERQGLDLSSWEVAFNGAEPVRARTLHRFARAFAPCGLDPKALYPCYGLAEATLMVSGGRLDRRPVVRRFDAGELERHRVVPLGRPLPRTKGKGREQAEGPATRELVGCGRVLGDLRVVVADPETGRACAAGEVGEIWIAGASVARGYWNRPEASAESFGGRLAGSGEGPYLRTGDLGFLHRRELFIAGRIKDLIILRGRNLYPQDLEATAQEAHPALVPAGGAAFSVEEEGEERLVVVHEVSRRLPPEEVEEVAAAVRRAVAAEHEAQVHRLVLIRAATLPKTSSGKVQRRACRERWLAGELRVVGESTLERSLARETGAGLDGAALAALDPDQRLPALTSWLRGAAARALAVEPARLDPGSPLLEAGLDSLAAAELAARVEAELGLALPFAELLEGLSLAGLASALSRRLDGEEGEMGTEMGAGPSGGREEPAPGGETPLSYGQRALWLEQARNPANAALNVVGAARLRDRSTPGGRVDAAALARAFAALLERHPILRTVYSAGPDGPVQELRPAAGMLDFAAVDATGWSSGRLERALAAAAGGPFDLAAGPVLRLRLYRTEPGQVVLLLVIHHVAADFTSLAVLVRELGLLYPAIRDRRPVGLPPLAATYADYVRWQRDELTGPRGAELAAFWRRLLAEPPPRLALPADRPRPPSPSGRGGTVLLALGEEAGWLESWARWRGATLFPALLAAFQVLLGRTAAQGRFAVGSPLAGRSLGGRRGTELAGLVGYFVNPLPLVADLAGDPTFSELLERTRRTALQAFHHGDLPLAWIAREGHRAGAGGRRPPFDVLFVLEKAPPSSPPGLAAFAVGWPGVTVAAGELELESIRVDPGLAQLDLSLAVAEVADRLVVSFEYSADLFDATTVRRLADHYDHLLAAVTGDAEIPLSRLPLLSPGEAHQLLVEWNDTAAPYPQAPLHELVAAQVAARPEAVALAGGGDHLSYGELGARSRRLARRLAGLGVAPGSVAALAVERSPEAVVAILGVLEAGAPYLPLDLAYPPDRLRLMLADSGAPVVLARRRDAGRTEELAAGTGARVVFLEQEPADGELPSPAPALPAVTADHPAYVIYTSGSTGRPKGVWCRHRGAVNMLASAERTARVPRQARVSLWTSLSFDVSVEEIFSALVYGRTLVVTPEEVRAESLAFFRWLAAERIVLACLPPFMFRDFARWLASEGKGNNALRALQVGIEPLPEPVCAEIARLEPELAVVNGYGPTETAVFSTYYRYPTHRARRRGEGFLSIGSPLGNTRLLLADHALAPVPVGVPGEISIGGHGLALGYLHRPALTAERFIPDPLAGGEEAGGRLYRTGDLARWLPDGNVDFLGRIDFQLKVRGFRVEPGEVEAALESHPAVARAVVGARPGASGAQLVAWVVPAETRRELPAVDRRKVHRWPNGFQVAFESSAEVEHFYEDLFEKRIYLRHGVELPDGATVFDVGANIGSFTLFAHATCRRPLIYAFEPAPPLFDKLTWNVATNGVTAQLLPCGLSDHRGTARFTFYPASSGMSSFHADLEEEKAVLAHMMHRQAERGMEGMDELLEFEEDLLAERFQSRTFHCPLRTLSEVMDEQGVEWIDLLKVDVQKSELEVLAGIRPEHWQGIRQVVMEVHDLDGRLARVRRLLEEKGFAVQVEQDELLEGSVLYNLFAVRPGGPGEAPPGVRERQRRSFFQATSLLPDGGFAGELQAFLRRRLPEHMVPAAVVALAALPSTPSGKLDRRALPEPEAAPGAEAAPPRGPVEEVLAAVWCEVLDVEVVARGQDFFALGGHSLAAAKVLARLREALGVELPLGALFESSTVAALARRVEEERRSGAGLAALPLEPLPLEPAPQEADRPLSFAQTRFWLIDQLEPGTPFYNIPAALTLRGGLDARALSRALAEIVRRHALLRTAFPAAGGRPAQAVAPWPAAVDLGAIDLTGLAPGDRPRAAGALARAEAGRPFDLAQGPPIRFRLLRLAPEPEGEHRLLASLHHIAADGASVEILWRELAALYPAFTAGRPSPLPELELQYADYAAWQRRSLGEEVLAPQLAAWRRLLAGAPTLLELPTDRPRPAVQSHRGGTVEIALAGLLGEAVSALGTGAGATPFMTLLAAFQALLGRTAGQPDLLVGSPIDGRSQLALERLIGPFVNTLALRARPRPELSFQQLLVQVRRFALDAYSHQDLPFERLVEELVGSRQAARSPLVQVAFALQATHPERFPLGDLEAEPWDFDSGLVRFELELHLWRGEGGGFRGFLAYDADLFDATTAGRLARRYARLLAEVAADPERPLGALSLLSLAEAHQLRAEWNDTAVELPRESTLHALFRARARERPDATALTAGEEWLSCRHLARRAGHLAAGLSARGLGADQVAGLALRREVAMVVATLAILEAGGAYLPLDPEWPPGRLETLLVEARCPLLLVRRRDAGPFATFTGERVILDDQEPAAATGHEAGLPPDPGSPEQLAYVMFTSGSTGRPKGVAIPHRGVIRLVCHATDRRRRRTVWPQLATLSFDAATLEIWAPLLGGGRLVLAPAGPASLEELARRLLRWRPTHLFLTTALFHQMAEGPVTAMAHLEQVFTGGEALSTTHAGRFVAALPGVTLTNLYGPTENTTATTTHRVTPGVRREPSVPIGRPLAGTRVSILDPSLGPVPAGVPGQLLTGGDGLARGYLARPALTAAAFLPDPGCGTGAAPGARLYATGDRARWLAGGSIEFLGRLDFQVKLRGFRVEPGEIEAALTAHPAVREAVVVAREDRPGDRRLVAYLTAAEEEMAEEEPSALDPQSLRRHLAASLPEYMLPSAFVLLDELPLTAHGKVDRRALPVPEMEGAGEAGVYVAPRDGDEEALAALWAQVLGVERVGVHDDFFGLGGHSLLATRLVARVRERCGVALPLRELFDHPTVAGLAGALRRARGPAASVTPPAAEPGAPEGGDQPASLSFAQERMWFMERLQPGLALYTMPFTLELAGPLDPRALAAAFDGVVARHQVLRSRYPTVDGQPVAVIAPPEPVALPAVDLSALPRAARRRTADRLARAEAARPFDLARGPLLRLRLLRLAAGEHLLLLAFHHMVCDGGSLAILVRDLGRAYGAARAGEPPELPPLELQYTAYARRQCQALGGEALTADLAWWRRRLAGAPEVLELPADRPRPPVESFRGASRWLAIPAHLATAAQELGRRRGATPYMVLLAAVLTLLYRLTGHRDLVVGSLVSGRGPETEELMGMFVNTLPLRVDLGGEPGFELLLTRAREAVLGAQAHREVPFERLVEELAPARDLSHNPLVQVVVSHQEAPLETTLPGLTVRALPVEDQRALFDLLLAFFPPAEAGGELLARLEYSTDLFDAATIRRFARLLVTLLAGAVAEPRRPVAELPLLTPAEGHQLRVEWGVGPGLPPAAGDTLHGPILARAEEMPERVAVIDGEGHSSYRQLGHRVLGLAGDLRGRGIGLETVVAVEVERREPMVRVLLAILAAGGAYVPLDPAYPPERLAFMLEDCGARLLLAHRSLEHRLPRSAVEVLWLEELESAAHARPPDRGFPPPPPEAAAYVLYTSGSTGRPKGVVIPHRAAAAFVAWGPEAFSPRELAGVLASTSLSFDLSVFELFLPLAHGGTVILAADALALARLPAASRVRTVNSVPGAAEELLRRRELPATVLTVNLGGEAFQRPLIRRLAAAGIGRVLDVYGPTEDTVYATFAAIRPEGEGPPVIGRPIPGARARVLDRRGRLVPVGVPGQLYLGGAGLARGYHRRPARTAQVFLPDPLGDEPGGRLYATGDLARWRSGGELEYMGRLDHQVKIRGFRIELGEIETVLAAHPGVAEAAVTAGADPLGDRRLEAWVVAAASPAPAEIELRAHLRECLPEHMVPALFTFLAALPRTPNGKVDRKALPAAGAGAAGAPAAPARPPAPPAGELEETIARVWREVLGRPRVGVEENFFDVGGHSLSLARVQSRLEEALDREVPLVDLFRFPTVRALAGHLGGAEATAGDGGPEPGLQPARAPALRPAAEGEAVAVVGLAGRFPGAPDLATFWRNLEAGVESIRRFSDQELAAAGVDPELLSRPEYVKARAVLDGVDLFDAELFGFSPREAATLDPQHRLLLETAWEALEDAGVDPARYGGAVGVFAGVAASSYWLHNLYDPERSLTLSTDLFRSLVANEGSYAPTLVSYKLGLTGPSLSVDTACSTSLVAVHLACRSLLAGECDLALAGAGAITVPQVAGYLFEEEAFLSPDGHCRPFDAGARGTVAGDGVGLVALKRLSDALADGDAIRGVIRGSAINNDGSRKLGYMAPGVEGQARVVAAALEAAAVDPETVTYVEAHGTATPLGDPVEITALTQAFRERGAQGRGSRGRNDCAVGSVKANVGHLDTAAGIAGLVKVLLMLEHRTLPPTLHFRRPNPKIPFDASPFYVTAEARPWRRREDGGPLRAGVSSFGIGGTNAHLVVEEAPPRPPAAPPCRPWQLLVLSARGEAALEEATDRLAAHLRAHPDLPLADVAYTLQTGRRAFEHRRVLLARETPEAAEILARRDPRRLWTGVAAPEGRPVAFLLPGLGDHYPGMAAGLYRSEAVFRRELNRCAELLEPMIGLDLRRLLDSEDGGGTAADAGEAHAGEDGLLDLRRMLGRGGPGPGTGTGTEPLERTAVSQPAVFAVEYALARLLAHWGIRPRALFGYSVGEYTAACLAGVLDLESALTLVARRAALIEELPGGVMLAVPLSEEEVRPLLGRELSLAAVNGSEMTVVAGPREAVAVLEAELAGREVAATRLRTAHAFHSRLLRPAAEPLTRLAGRFDLRPPRIPLLSNVTGSWLTPAEATDPAYWARHMVSPVRFAGALTTLAERGEHLLLEVGPGQSLASLARQHPAWAGATVVATLRHDYDPQPDPLVLLSAVARLWLAGVELDGEAFAGPGRRRLPLPTYPFQRKSYWIEPARRRTALSAEAPRRQEPALPAAPEKRPVADWLYLPAWRRAPLPLPAARVEEPIPGPSEGRWLLFAPGPDDGLTRELARLLAAGGRRVVTVLPGEGFTRRADGAYTLEPGKREGYERLLADLDGPPAGLLQLWAASPLLEGADIWDGQVDPAAASLATLAAVLPAGEAGAPPLPLLVVTRGAQTVAGGEPLCPGRHLLPAVVETLARERPHLACRTVDLDAGPALRPFLHRRAAALLAELAASEPEGAVAYRGSTRWEEAFQPVTSASEALEVGTYLLLGDLAGLAGQMAGALAEAAAAEGSGLTLVVVEREAMPPRGEWEAMAAGGEVPAALRARAALALEETLARAGGRLMVAGADPEDPAELEVALHEALADAPTPRLAVLTLGDLLRSPELFAPLSEVAEAAEAAGNGGHPWQPLMASLSRRLSLLEAALAPMGELPCLVESSLATAVGGVGLAGHAALARAVDAFVRSHNRRSPAPWLSLALDRVAGGDDAEPVDGAAELAITPAELPALLAAALPLMAEEHLLVSVADLAARRRAARTLPAASRPAEAAGGGHGRPDLPNPYVAPSSDTERQLAALWSELLGVEPVGIHDSFFDLGGHSLLGARLVGRLRKKFDVELRLRHLFEAPTVSQMALLIEALIIAQLQEMAVE